MKLKTSEKLISLSVLLHISGTALRVLKKTGLIAIVFFALITHPTLADDAIDTDFIQSIASELNSKNKSKQIDAINLIANSEHARRSVWLELLLEGKLYVQKSTKNIVIAEKNGKLYSVKDVNTDAVVGEEKKRALSKIKINNSIRGHIKKQLSLLALNDSDPTVRDAAINSVIGKADESTRNVVQSLLEKESNQKVKKSMALLLSVYDLDNGSEEEVLSALEGNKATLNNEFVNKVRSLSLSGETEKIKSLASQVLATVEKKRAWYAKIETLFFGVSLGSVLVVAAIGLAITFGVMGVINMAHGELIMLGAYTTYFVQMLMPNAINYSLIVALPAAFLVSAFVGILIERFVIRHLYGRPLETLLATFGISLMLQQAVRTFVSSQNVAVINPSWMSGSWIVNPALSLTLNRMVIIAFCLVVFAALLLLFSKSGFGLQMRAVAQDRTMAKAMGIRSSRIDALTFGLGSGIAGIAGVALSQLGNVGPNLGQNYIIDSFMVVVFGGVGNLWGTLVAGMSLGIANKFVEPWAGAVMAKIIILVFIILFIQRRPRGLFPQRGRAVEG